MAHALLLLAGVLTLHAAEPSLQIRVDFSQAPDTEAYAAPSQAVCEEWYSRINEILCGPGHPLPYREIKIFFQPWHIVGTTDANVIHVSSDWLKQPHELDFRAVVVHELTHVTQNYPDYSLHWRKDGWHGVLTFFRVRLCLPNSGLEWLEEGIADYVTYTYFTKSNEPRLHLDKDGYLHGYTKTIPFLFGLQEKKLRIGPKSYRYGYTVTSAFLLWLEQRKDKDIVRTLNAALLKKRYSAELLQQHCGAPLNRLWQEFLAQSMQ